MRRRISREEISDYIRTEKGRVTGIYRKWIVLRSILKGEGIFTSIKDKDFYSF